MQFQMYTPRERLISDFGTALDNQFLHKNANCTQASQVTIVYCATSYQRELLDVWNVATDGLDGGSAKL
jgi:carbonic anhydrase